MKKVIVLTTIQAPTESVKKFAKLKDFEMIVAGDNKTPKDWVLENVKYISISQQKRDYPDLSKYISENHYARKNFAYLEAVKLGADLILETDDDNYPNGVFKNENKEKFDAYRLDGETFINVYKHFTKERIWPRGLPLNFITRSGRKRKVRAVEPQIVQSLVDLDPDVDAIYRLTSGAKIKFTAGRAVYPKKGSYSPFNSQATYWRKNVFPLLYLPTSVNSRVTDIWRGYIAQRILSELDYSLVFVSPMFFQKRNVHNFIKDFEDETDLYLKTESMVREMDRLNLKGSINKMLIQVYEVLIKKSYFLSREMKGVKTWLTYF